MKKVAVLVHGFNVEWPERTVGKLAVYFEQRGYKVIMFRYGHTNIFEVTERNPKLAEALAQLVNHHTDTMEHEVTVVGHSNGAAIIYLASLGSEMELPIKPKRCIAINPALQSKLHPCIEADETYVWHNKKDKPVLWAKRLTAVLRWLGFKKVIKARPWGAMGRVGYMGTAVKDPSVININSGFEFLPYRALGHSGIFDSSYFMYRVARSEILDTIKLGDT